MKFLCMQVKVEVTINTSQRHLYFSEGQKLLPKHGNLPVEFHFGASPKGRDLIPNAGPSEYLAGQWGPPMHKPGPNTVSRMFPCFLGGVIVTLVTSMTSLILDLKEL